MNHIDDELALRRLSARYIDAVNRRDGEDWIRCWSEDGRWSLLGNSVSGRGDILGFWQQLMAGFDFVLMLPGSSLFDINGERAEGHCYLQEHSRDSNGQAASIIGRYRDVYRRTDGQWLFEQRDYTLLYSGPADLSGHYHGAANASSASTGSQT